MEYLAFDFGDGTVCAASFNSKCGNAKSLIQPEVLNIEKGKYELWSTLAKKDKGKVTEIAIGLKEPRRGYSSLKLNWKSRPNVKDEGWEERRGLTVEFMKHVFKLFLSNNPYYTIETNENSTIVKKNDIDCKIAIGVPCDWSDSDIEEYKKMADEAGLGNVTVFKEAQAAVLYARKFMGDGLPDDYIKEGTLLIDLGSSTLDFTYLKQERASNRGLTLGAKYVEQSFLGDAMKKANYVYYRKEDSAASIEEGKKILNWNLASVRGYKEEFFNDVDKARTENRSPEIKTSPLDGSNLKLGDDERYITQEYVDKCLNSEDREEAHKEEDYILNKDKDGYKFILPHLSEKWKSSGLNNPNTWRGHFRTALKHLIKIWTIDPTEVTIVLTGGASRMQFVEDDIKKVLGDKVRILTGDVGQQSFSVVKGLAWALYATDLVNDARNSLKQDIEKKMATNSVQEKLKEKLKAIVKEIAKRVGENVAEELADKMLNAPETVNTENKIKNCASESAKRKLEEIIKYESNEIIKDESMSIMITKVVNELLEIEDFKNLFQTLQAQLGRSSIYSKQPPATIDSKYIIFDNLDFSDLVTIDFLEVLKIIGLLITLPISIFFIKDYDDKIIKNEKIQKWAGGVKDNKDKIAMKIEEVLNSQEKNSFLHQLEETIMNCILDVKEKELKALEGLVEING